MYELANTKSNGNAERNERGARKRPKRHIGGRVAKVPRVPGQKVQQPAHPGGRRHDEVDAAENQPVAPIFEDGAEPAQEAQRLVIQVEKVRQRWERGQPQRPSAVP